MQRNVSTDTNRERLREAITALRGYQPLALEVLELTLLLDRLADIALEDVKAVNNAEAGPRTSQAIDHLEAIIDERRHTHVDQAMDHVDKALRLLKPFDPRTPK